MFLGIVRTNRQDWNRILFPFGYRICPFPVLFYIRNRSNETNSLLTYTSPLSIPGVLRGVSPWSVVELKTVTFDLFISHPPSQCCRINSQLPYLRLPSVSHFFIFSPSYWPSVPESLHSYDSESPLSGERVRVCPLSGERVRVFSLSFTTHFTFIKPFKSVSLNILKNRKKGNYVLRFLSTDGHSSFHRFLIIPFVPTDWVTAGVGGRPDEREISNFCERDGLCQRCPFVFGLKRFQKPFEKRIVPTERGKKDWIRIKDLDTVERAFSLFYRTPFQSGQQ